MEYILADTNPKLISAWRELFSEMPQVKIIAGDITQLKADALVSPANSFGFMDGSLDYAIAQKYHWNLNPQGMIWTH